MPLIPRRARNAPSSRAAFAVVVVLAALLSSGCGDWIVGSTEVVPEELLVLRANTDTHGYQIAWVAPDGSELRIHPEMIDRNSVSVSPDREWVAYRSIETGMEMKRMRTDGTGVTGLDTPPISHTPRWSPDGSLLAIQNDEAVYVMPASGGTAVDVSSEAIAGDGGCHGTDRGMLRNYGFTGDGRVIFDNYVCGVGSHYYSVRIDGSDSRRITEFSPERAHWSPDGTRVLFAEGGAVHLMNADGSDRRMLEDDGVLPNRFFDSSNPWSPDGRRVAFRSGGAIVILDADGQGRMEIEADAWTNMSWSHDGRIAFNSSPGDDLLLFVADPASGVVTRVPSPPDEYFRRPFWVPAP